MKQATQTAITLDQQHCWHPFTQQTDWCNPDTPPLMIERGEGVWLWDTEGHKYVDGNSSIWTNIHGHAHPKLIAAMTAQLNKIAHSSFLGFGHPLASELAAKLSSLFPPNTLQRVFFSDDGSTAMEVALKLSLQYHMQTGASERTHFLAMSHCYHGDTLGAASLGGVASFFERFQKVGHPCHHASSMDDLRALPKELLNKVSALVIEPLVQGVNQIHIWEKGMLAELRQWTSENHIHLILDEVMTGFGRTGSLFACMQEDVIPDFLCCAKGLSGGYSPLAATFCKEQIYEGFLKKEGHDNTFYYGHSFTAHPLGCAAALASLRIFEETDTLALVAPKGEYFASALRKLKDQFPEIHEIRQIGLVLGIDIRRPNGEHFPAEKNTGSKICLAARQHGLLTRPILDCIVLMPPLCISYEEIDHCVRAIQQSLQEIFLTQHTDS